MVVARILIIEDNTANLELEEYLLTWSGYLTLSATDGREGLGAAMEQIPDLILCDLQMPVMDGYELIGKFKSNRNLQHIPVVAVTASSMSGDSSKALAAGFDGYISKPLELETFVQQIEVFIPEKLRVKR